MICTATQPAFQKLFPEQIKVRELCPDVREQYDFFQRVTIEQGGLYSEDRLIEALKGEPQVLCILNSRKRVQKLYEALKGPGTFHLSTLMYPEHRKRVLEEIRTRLIQGRVCRLISTSLVEAGVDFDFPAVFRELAGIDSIIQAAGRCNREGKRKKEESRTVVFTLEKTEGMDNPSELKLPLKTAAQIVEKYQDISSMEAISEYFSRLYEFKGDGLDSKDIVGRLEQGVKNQLFPFESVAKDFRLIESDTRSILIGVEPEASEIAGRIRRGEHSRQLVREAGRFCVNVYERDFENFIGAGMLEPLDAGFYLLRNGQQYTEEMGLMLNVSRGEAVMF